jgi:hypothetical protein
LNKPLAAIDGFGATRRTGTTLHEIVALLRLASFMKVDGRDIAGRDLTIALLAVTALTAWIVVDPLLHSRELVFSWYAIPDVACVGAGLLALAWLLHKLARPALEFQRALVLALGALPLAMLGAVASWKLVEATLLVLGAALAVYAFVFFARGLRALTGRRQPVALLAGTVATAAFMFSLDYLQADPRLWVRAEDRTDRLSAAGVDWARMSRVQFHQQSRIDADVSRLAAQDSAAMDVYFLGFAGYGHQQVFAREIDLASRVVDSRYGSGERSLRLVNDHSDLDSWPIASEPGLRHALRRLGESMGDEDVLFMVLSSHGDRGEGVRVSSPGTVTTQLDPRALDAMLDEAGILWRVIVVSACYSGSFVDALSNEHTIVITAAAQDRKSFGCNDSRALTYFGEAFFRDALGKSGSLRGAFHTARAALEKKERASGIVPSRPQASFGRQLEARLDEPGSREGRAATNGR